MIWEAFFGVVADRVCRLFEQKPRLDIVGGVFESDDGDGYFFEITNRGVCEVPPFQISFYHPCCGSIIFFSRNKNDALLPDQTVKFKYVFIEYGKLTNDCLDFYLDKPRPGPTRAQADNFVFRLILDNSDKILYENESIGRDFIKGYQKLRETKNIRDMEFAGCIYEPLHKKVLGKCFSRKNKMM